MIDTIVESIVIKCLRRSNEAIKKWWGYPAETSGPTTTRILSYWKASQLCHVLVISRLKQAVSKFSTYYYECELTGSHTSNNKSFKLNDVFITPLAQGKVWLMHFGSVPKLAVSSSDAFPSSDDNNWRWWVKFWFVQRMEIMSRYAIIDAFSLGVFYSQAWVE